MARFIACLLAIALAASQVEVHAAPLASRAGNNGNFIQCNVARLKIVTSLASTSSSVQKISGAAGIDAATTAAVTSAQTGLKDAQIGIQTIAKALLSRQSPPAAAREQVGKGLNTAQTALASINSTNTAVTSQVNDAKAKLKQSISAGQQVVDNCGTAAVNPNPSAPVPTATNVETTIPIQSMTATAITGIGFPTAVLSPPLAGSIVAAPGAVTGIAISATPSLTTKPGVTTASSAIASVTTKSVINQATNCPAQTVVTITSVTTVTAQPSTTTAPANNASGIKVAGDGLIRKRQIGNLRCNAARLQAVRGLSASTKAVAKVATAAGNDAATESAVEIAQTGLESSRDGIDTIAKALLAGQLAPAAGRIQVDDGLKAAQSALQTITLTDPAVVSAISDAQSQIAKTLTASASVASNCK